MYSFNINGDHFKICLMVVGLTFVIYQRTPSVCILKLVDRKIILPRVITLPHFLLPLRPVFTSILFYFFKHTNSFIKKC